MQIKEAKESIPRPDKVVFEPVPNGNNESWVHKKFVRQYTPEQIRRAERQLADYLERMKPISESGGLPSTTALNKYIAIILSALTTVEQERDTLKISCAAKDKDIAYAEARSELAESERAELQSVLQSTIDAAEARVKELEAAVLALKLAGLNLHDRFNPITILRWNQACEQADKAVGL